MSTKRPAFRWTRWGAFALTLLWSLTTAILVLFNLQTPLRPWVTLSFLILAPGLVLLRPLQLHNPQIEVPLAVALSLSLDGLVAMALIYLHVWSPQLVLILILDVTVMGLALDLIRDMNPVAAVRDLMREPGLEHRGNS